MNTVKRNLMIRVVTKRMAEGETMDEVLASYPGLTDEESRQIRDAIY